MRWVAIVLLSINAGCVSESLRYHTVNQALSLSSLRYEEVLDNLAVVAANNGTLPSFAVNSGGTANVTNSISANATTLIDQAVNGFSKETLNFVGGHNPDLQWTVAPVVAEPNLEALKYACLWAVAGRPADGSPAMELLRAADSIDLNTLANGGRAPGFHFNVATQLERLPACWLHIGCRKDVPRRACYKARCGNSYVWVEPEGMAGLSAFTLVVLDIATTDPKSLVLPKPAAKVDIQENLRTVEGDKVKEAANKDGPKITEQWYASQEMSADGKNLVYIGRPGTIHGALGNSGKLVIPVITPTAFSQEPAPPTPTQQFFLTTPRASGF